MGVPKFFRWIVDRYPAVATGVINETYDAPVIDNFYIDMNGIIHWCSHSDNKLDEEVSAYVVAVKVIAEVERLVEEIVKPIKLLYIAVDGVAPRAKLNQQRARRFRAGQERMAAVKLAREKGDQRQFFDSNSITPGTVFLFEVCGFLKNWIASKVGAEGVWKQLEVIFSGCDTPGEGEHKIIHHIRQWRSGPNYTCNTRHCIYGSDADMMMLSLATHEPFFLVLREVLEPLHKQKNWKDKKKKDRDIVEKEVDAVAKPVGKQSGRRMQFVRIQILREYVLRDLLEDNPFENPEKEKIIDDFIFLTFFVGNDFLPHLPAIDIRDDAFNIIFDAYKNILAAEPGYLIDGGSIDYNRLEVIFRLIGVTEMTLFAEKGNALLRRKDYNSNKKFNDRRGGKRTAGPAIDNQVISSYQVDAKSNSNMLKSSSGALGESASLNENGEASPATLSTSTVVQLTEEEHRRLYYQTKLNLDVDNSNSYDELQSIKRSYLLGLQWCLEYYSRGCTSWRWYYPYNYGPFLHDMTDLAELSQSLPAFELSQPFTPYQQLLACLPSSSSSLLPQAYGKLMTESYSPILDFYPTDFVLDLNGKKNEWEAVIILPFIEESRLIEAERDFCLDSLSGEEIARNTKSPYHLYAAVPKDHAVKLASSCYLVEFACDCSPSSNAFAAVLHPGTSLSLPGYPAMDELTVRDFQKTSGGFSYSRKHGNKKNCYEDSSFAMPGAVTLSAIISSNISIEEVDLEDPEPDSEINLSLDERMAGILTNLATQINAQEPHFLTLNNLELEDEDIKPIAYSLRYKVKKSKILGISSSQENLNRHIRQCVETTSVVFPPIMAQLRPYGKILENGDVIIFVADVSHLSQFEEFLYERIYNISAQDSTNDQLKKYFNCGIDSLNRGIVIGNYCGTDHNRFSTWLNTELQKIVKYLPQFTCTVMHLIDSSSSNTHGSYGLRGGSEPNSILL